MFDLVQKKGAGDTSQVLLGVCLLSREHEIFVINLVYTNMAWLKAHNAQ